MRDEGKAKSPDPTDKKFKSVKDKYYPNFGYEYKEPKKQGKNKDKKKKKKK